MKLKFFFFAMIAGLSGCIDTLTTTKITNDLKMIDVGDQRHQIYFKDRLVYEGHVLDKDARKNDVVFYVVDIGDLQCIKGHQDPYFSSKMRLLMVDSYGSVTSKIVVPNSNYCADRYCVRALVELRSLQDRYPHFFISERCENG